MAHGKQTGLRLKTGSQVSKIQHPPHTRPAILSRKPAPLRMPATGEPSAEGD